MKLSPIFIAHDLAVVRHGGASHLRSRDGDVPRPRDGTRRQARAVRLAAPSLYARCCRRCRCPIRPSSAANESRFWRAIFRVRSIRRSVACSIRAVRWRRPNVRARFLRCARWTTTHRRRASSHDRRYGFPERDAGAASIAKRAVPFFLRAWSALRSDSRTIRSPRPSRSPGAACCIREFVVTLVP